jgi:putative ABC transport system permease protein
MQPFESIHLHSDLTYEIEPNGNARTVNFLGLVALFILAIAFINYVNMTTARSMERAKEVGLRKTVGANRRQLAGQFLFEGLLLNGIAIALALIVLQPLLPLFSDLVGRPLAAQPAGSSFVLSVIALFLLGLLASCGYPALVLTKFSPLEVLRGRAAFSKGSGNKHSWLRQGLVVFQFACSALLIFGLIVIGKQLHFLQNHDKGLSLDQIVAIKTSSADWRQDSINRLKMGVFKNDIAQIAGIQAKTVSSIVPGLGISTISGTSSGLVLASKRGEILPGTIYFISAQPDFYATYNIRFLAGASYQAMNESDGYKHLIINEAACDLWGFGSPEAAIGQELAYPNSASDFRMRIEGVVADFHIETLKEPTRPTLYYCTPDVRNGYVSIKLEGSKAQDVLAAVEASWKKTYPESPFEYWFLNEQFAHQYKAETQLGKTFGLFSALAVLIACLGLLGLAAYSASQRTKEIGVRKVLGASVAGITRLLTQDFLKPVVVGVLCAAPIGYYFMQKWLQDFAHRIEMQWWMFAAAGAAAVGIAFLTVGFQSVKAALANPVKSLRSE